MNIKKQNADMWVIQYLVTIFRQVEQILLVRSQANVSWNVNEDWENNLGVRNNLDWETETYTSTLTLTGKEMGT